MIDQLLMHWLGWQSPDRGRCKSPWRCKALGGKTGCSLSPRVLFFVPPSAPHTAGWATIDGVLGFWGGGL